MKSKLSGILLVSDLDGPLINNNFSVPKRNIDAIERLKKEGGYFSIASGRSMKSGRGCVEISKPNVPCILMNGTVLYDFENEKIIWDNPLCKDSIKYIESIRKEFPNVGIEIYADREIYLINAEYYVKRHMKNEKIECPKCSIKDVIGKKIYKVLFAMENKFMKDVIDFVNSINHAGVNFVATSDNYYEMISSSVNKGEGLLKLSEILNVDLSKTYAIGDYYNDIEMVKAAHIGVATYNAVEALKRVADITVGSCDDGAVADLVEYIEKI